MFAFDDPMFDAKLNMFCLRISTNRPVRDAEIGATAGFLAWPQSR